MHSDGISTQHKISECILIGAQALAHLNTFPSFWAQAATMKVNADFPPVITVPPLQNLEKVQRCFLCLHTSEAYDYMHKDWIFCSPVKTDVSLPLNSQFQLSGENGQLMIKRKQEG